MTQIKLTLGRTSKFIPPLWYKGEVDGTSSPKVFVLLMHREIIFHGVESRFLTLQVDIFFNSVGKDQRNKTEALDPNGGSIQQ